MAGGQESFLVYSSDDSMLAEWEAAKRDMDQLYADRKFAQFRGRFHRFSRSIPINDLPDREE